MKRVSLYLSMLLAAVFSLSAVTPVKTSTADDPVWYTIANPRFNGGQINEVNGALTKTAGFTEGSFWRFEKVGSADPDAVYIINYQTGDKLYHPNSTTAATPGVTSTASSSAYWYLIEQPDWGVTGWIISVTGQNSGTACLDASNANAVFSGGWHASSGDYEGTTWTITEVSNDAARESFYSNFVALKQPVLFGEAGVAQIKAAIDTKFQVSDDPVSTYINMATGLSEARTIYNATYPQVLKDNANGKSFSFYMPVAARNAGYLVPTDDNLTTSGTYSASAIWTMTVNDDNTIYIQNLPTGKYAKGAQGTSQAWTMVDDAYPLSIYYFDAENTITLSKVNPGTYEYLHKGAGNVVGWGTGADASKWIVAEADLQPIVDEANAQINGALANKDAIIAGLTATGLWTAAEIQEFADALNDITPLNVDDYETPAEIAQAVDAKLAAVTEAFALVSTKTFAVYNLGCGLTDNTPAYLSLADGNLLNTIAAPTAKAQWSFDVVNGELVLVEKNINTRTYLAALNGSNFSTATASANALPITIAASTAADKIANQITISAEAGALSCANGGNLTTGDAASANAQWVLVELTGSILTLPGSTAAIEDLNFVIGSFNRGGYFTTDIIMPGAALQHAAEGPYSYWKLVPTGNENGYYIKSAAASFYIGASRTITDTPAEWFILPTGVNDCGVAISSVNPISGSCCIDANNYNNGVGAWRPSAGDWQGSTWVVAAVSEGTVEAALDGVNPAEGVSGLAENVVSNLVALPNIYSPETIEQIKERINAATNDENLSADERIAAIGKLMEEAVAGICGKPFMLANVRRMNRAIGNEVSAGINTLSYIAVNNGGSLQMNLVTPGATSVLKFENAGSGKVKIAGMNVGPYYIYNNSTDDQTSFCLVNSLDAATPQGINVDLSAAGNIVTYNAKDAGSRWVMIDPFKPFDVPVKGAEHYAVFTSYNRGGVLTAQTALGVNPETAAVQHTDVALGSFWAVTPAEKPGYYTLKNALNDLYLTNEFTFSETPVEWYIAPNAGNPEAGLAISVAPDGQGIDASNAGAGVGLWKPNSNDWQGTTWIVASYAGNVANMAAQNFCANANLNSIKTDLNRVIADTPWGVSALSQGVADCETFNGGADFKGDYIAAAKYVMNLKNEICENYFNAVATEAAGSKVLLQNIRRTNAGKANNTLTASNEEGNVPMLGLGAAFDNPASTWYVEESDTEGYFTLHSENGYYLGSIAGVSQQVTISEDPAAAAKFYFWPVLLGGDNSGIAIIDANTGLAMNVNQMDVAYLVGYYYSDGGSTWKIIPTSQTSAIDEVELGNENFNINDSDVELFNLQGIRVNAADAAPGIYIARKAGVVLKVRKF